MNEERQVKKQLKKNMLFNLIAFSIIFYIFGTFVYSKFHNSLYISADSELKNASMQVTRNNDIRKKRDNKDFSDENKMPKPEERDDGQPDSEQPPQNQGFEDIKLAEQNPRLVFIYRAKDGSFEEESDRNSKVSDIVKDVYFNKDLKDEIYEVTINNQYNYRCINIGLSDGGYVQVLINVDAEKSIAEEFRKILIIAIIVCIILILIASYILSRRTLKPIISSWKKQTEFVQNASHELRTPLTIIKAKQEKLLENPESKIIDKAEDISISLQETQRLTKLIKELMDIARSDSNEMVLNKQIFNLDSDLEPLIMLYADTAKSQSKKMSLDFKYGETINADMNKIKQLMVILLDNSIKYTEVGDSIEVKTYKKDGKCYIEVNDTGIGMSKEDQEHIFERFYRSEKSRNRESGGMGLGLSLAYNIVRAHRGMIKVENNQTKGTKFVIKLPKN